MLTDMLKFSLLFAFFVVTSIAQEGEREGESESESEGTDARAANFFEYTFDDLFHFAYSPDQCSATDFTGSSYIMPICITPNEIEVSFYSDSTCTTATSTTKYNSSSSQIFYCSGADSYAQVRLGIGQCDVAVFVGIGSCVQHLTASTQFYSSFMCSDVVSNLTVFNSSTCSASKVSTYTFVDSCNYGFEFGPNEIYGQAISCEVSTPGISTTDDGNAGNRIAINGIIGLFVMIGSIVIASF